MSRPFLLPLFTEVRRRGVLRSSAKRRSPKFAAARNSHVRAKITHLGYALDTLKCDPLLVRNISRKVSRGNHLITLCEGEPARSTRCAAVGVRPTGSRPLTVAPRG